MITVNKDNFQQEVIESSQIVLINFWAPWCGLCVMLNPVLNKIESQWSEYLKVVSINADDNFPLATFYRLSSLPTLIMIKKGDILLRLEDFHNREDIYHIISQTMTKLP